MLHAEPDLVGGVKPFFGVHQRRQHLGQVGRDGIGAPDREGERFQTALAGFGGQRALFRLVGEVKVFKPLGRLGGEDVGFEGVGQFALVFDGLENGLLAFGQLAQLPDPGLNHADDFFVEPAGTFLAVARNKWDGVALVEQSDHALDLHLAYLQVLGDAREIEAVYFMLFVHERRFQSGRQQTGTGSVRSPRLRVVTCPSSQLTSN